MIINIRGANGAGKSTIVRKVFPIEKAKPGFYKFDSQKPNCLRYLDTCVVGHYSIANGGGDTVRQKIDRYYDLVHWLAQHYRTVLFEGKNQSDDKALLLMLSKLYTTEVVHVRVSLDQCIMSVRARGHKLSEKSIAATWRKMERDADWLEAAGVVVHRLNHIQATRKVRDLLWRS